MEILKGIGVSPGVAISQAIVLDAEDLVIPRRTVDPADAPAEVGRYRAAVQVAVDQLGKLRVQADAGGGQIGGIFDFHLGLLRDPVLVREIEAGITGEYLAAESAVSQAIRKTAAMFGRMKDSFFAERVKDVHDVERRILHELLGSRQEELTRLTNDAVVIAHDLLPSQTASLDKQHVKGFACDVGGRTSHTAIVARAMSIPAVVGLGEATGRVASGQTVIIDGTHGFVIVDPDPQQLVEYRALEERQRLFNIELASLRDLPAVTLDGHQVTLLANIEFPHEVGDALNQGAEGVGLYRTEFLYLAHEGEPSEEEHYDAYAQTIEALDGRPVVLRTLDLGADKYDPKRMHTSQERNPFLGDRSIRLCLHDIPMFKRQLRAILRACLLGDVRIMFPMISTVMELRQAKMVLSDVFEELEEEGVPFKRDVPVGIMVEVPSAALMAPMLAKESAFFSIGTNDLIQYTMAVDRTNEKVAGLYTPAHPSVLMLVRDIIRAGQKANIPVSVCGEMAGDPIYTLLLLGLGLTTFSMNGPDVPEVKKIVRSTTLAHARTVARKVMTFDSERQVTHYLREETRKLLPEVV